RVVGRAVLDGVVENRRVGRETGHRELVDVACERAGLEQVAGNVVEPDTLTSVVERLRGFHRVTSTGSNSGKSSVKRSPIRSTVWTVGAVIMTRPPSRLGCGRRPRSGRAMIEGPMWTAPRRCPASASYLLPFPAGSSAPPCPG